MGALEALDGHVGFLAEVAILEEEVVRLKEQVLNLRLGLCQEAVFISDLYAEKCHSEITNSSDCELAEALSNQFAGVKKPLLPVRLAAWHEYMGILL